MKMAASVLINGCRFIHGLRFVMQNSVRRSRGRVSERTKILSSDASLFSTSDFCYRKCQYHTSRFRRKAAEESKPNTGPDLSSQNIIETWFHEVKTFGTLTVKDAPFDIHIQPLNPMEYPTGNKAIVQVFYDTRKAPPGGGPLHGQKLSEMSRLYDMKVIVDEEGETVDVKCDLPDGIHLPIICIISLPLKYVLRLVGNRSHDICISGMESPTTDIHLKNGNCILDGLKCGAVNIQCDNGNIVCKRPLLGNINMKCQSNGNITGDRFQGSTVECATENGNINVNMLYAENSHFTSVHGDLRIGGSHGSVEIQTREGNLMIDSMDGSLNAELGTGSADVFITRQSGVDISTKEGDISLRFPQDFSCGLDLQASIIEQNESLAVHLDQEGKGFLKSDSEAKVKATAAAGKISLKTQDWLASLKLQFPSLS